MNENDARVKAYMKAAGLIKTTDETSQKDDLSIKLPSNVRLEKNENANPEISLSSVISTLIFDNVAIIFVTLRGLT